jgi:predicted nucleotidyltransferase
LRYRKLTVEEKERLLESLRKELEGVDGIVFAYVHGGFVEMDVFRDVDVAVWIKNPEDALDYEVDFSAKLEADLKTPIDLHALNQAPLSFRHHALTRGKLLFSKDEETRIRLIDETVRQYADLKKLREG